MANQPQKQRLSSLDMAYDVSAFCYDISEKRIKENRKNIEMWRGSTAHSSSDNYDADAEETEDEKKIQNRL